ncbi:MAG: TlpA family protein disulfide reductase [Schleiferiaceae bacterium]
MKNVLLTGAISMALFSCSQPEPKAEKVTGQDFIGSIIQNDSTRVSFNVHLQENVLTFYNGVQESFEVALRGEDTLRGTFPVFASDLWLVATEDGYRGEYYRTDANNYRLPLELVPGGMTFEQSPSEFPSQYAITRSIGDQEKPALLQLSKKDGVLVGTIATSTGDSRFMTGYEVEGGFELMGFDGRFIYKVSAKVTDGNIEGHVWAGMTGYYTFSGTSDESAELENPEEMSKLRDDYTHIEWHLPGLNGDTVHFDSRTITKPTILAIQGSWCPNCMDEGRVLDQYYREFEGAIDVYGLSYEYSGTLEKATAAVQKMERDLGTSFPMVIATYGPKQDRNAVLPLEQIRSYPTSIMLDHQGNVVKIHTGFYGPSTKEYETYVKETREELEALVAKANG